MTPVGEIILIYAYLCAGLFLLVDSLLIYLSIRVFAKHSKMIEMSDNETYSLHDSELPTITILLPVYREEVTLPYLIENLIQADYPKNKLDIRILVEHDDYTTLKTIMALPTMFGVTGGIKYSREGRLPKIVKVSEQTDISIDYIFLNPPGARSKANSVNKGLVNAKGNIVTIFDAEDRPDIKQIRKMATYLVKHRDVACVQARLAYYNSDQSIITRLFSIEYIQHFLLLLPAFHYLNKVILLGGSSNFFRTEVLREVNGWKTDNVTEDADMGVCLARLGYKVVPINTITWEEAPPKLYPWIRQRTRWNKGYLYTLFAHFRNPRRLYGDIGFSSMVFLFYLLFSPATFSISVPGWILFAAFWTDNLGIVSTQPLSGWIHEAYSSNSIIFYIAVSTFIFGVLYNPIFAIEALFRQGDEYALKKVKYSYLMSIYLYLQSIPATIAIIELFTRPKVWHKTYHGFSLDQKGR